MSRNDSPSEEQSTPDYPSWWRKPSYRHFGAPLSLDTVRAIIATPETVAQHSFWPLLRHVKTVRRFDHTTRKVKRKERALLYAAPGDVNLMAYYREQLSALYEAEIAARGLHEPIIAYRPARRGSSVHFALEAFAWMREAAPCSVYCFDIRSFFDQIDHALLKTRWCELLGLPVLPADHYAIYSALTRFAWVDRRGLPEALSTQANSHTLCTAAEFRRLRREKKITIHRHPEPRGIPQGLSLSNLLSNLYLLPFDCDIQAAVNARQGFYRRYCDDVFIVLPQSHADDQAFEALVREQLAALALPLNDEKTSRHRLRRGRVGHERLTDKPVQYLGLIDDGRQVLLRGTTLGRFHRRMTASARNAKKQARQRGQQIPKGQLRRRFAMRGSRNFLAYSARVERTLKAFGFARPLSVRRQLGRAPRRLERLLDE